MFKFDRRDMTYKITGTYWLEQRDEGWFVGERFNHDGRTIMHGPCPTKDVALLLRAELVQVFQSTTRALIERFTDLGDQTTASPESG